MENKNFKIVNDSDCNVVVITLPKVAVPKCVAEQYIRFANKICSDLRNMFVKDVDSIIDNFDFQTEYINNLFIPIRYDRDDFQNILHKFMPDVEQVKKYVRTSVKHCYDLDKDDVYTEFTKQKQEVEA